MAIDPDLFRHWHRLPAASPELLARLVLEVARPLPSGYLSLLGQMNGGEGVLGEAYVRLYPADQLLALNRAYGVPEWLPGYLLIGSNGGGEALALAPDDSIVEVPFIPMDPRYARPRAPDWDRFFAAGTLPGERPEPSPAYIGKEIHEIQPLIFGGDPCDPANKTALTPEEHAPVVVWWNRKFREVAPNAAV